MAAKKHFIQAMEWAKKNPFFLAGVVLFVILFGVYYPPSYVSIDEHEYLKNAHLLVQGGTIVAENPSLYCGGVMTPLTQPKSISSYSIGRSLLLIPFTFLPFSFSFASGLLLHLLNLILIYFILKEKNVPVNYSLLYLFFPAAAWEARTLFPELSVLTLFLGAYYLWMKKGFRSTLGAGLLLGLSVFFRVDAIIGPAAFLVQALVKERPKILPLILGGLIPALLFFGFNTINYGGALSTGYGSVGEQIGQQLNPYFVKNALTYILLLFIAVPFSVGAIFRLEQRKEWPLFAALFAGYVFFFSHFTNFWDLPFSLPLTFTARLRYFLPLAGMLLIPSLSLYHAWIAQFRSHSSFSKIPPKVALIAFLLLAGMGLFFLNASHYELAEPRQEISSIIQNTIPPNATVIGSADDCIYFLSPVFGAKHYYKVDQTPPSILESEYYVIDVSYATQQDKDGKRQDIIDGERKIIKEFITAHSPELQKLTTHSDGFNLTIWKKGGIGK
jgi:hypothetical protein